MEHIWQWAWDRFAARYSWAAFLVTFPVILMVYLLPSAVVVVAEKSDRYAESAAATVIAVLVLVYVMILPGRGPGRLVDQWAAGREVDRKDALDATYAWGRGLFARAVWGNAVGVGLLLVVVAAVAGASESRLVQYAVLGATFAAAVQLIAVHSFSEAAVRPARVAIAGDTGIGDSLPRSSPTFAVWSNASILATAFAFATGGAMLAAAFGGEVAVPVLAVVIGGAVTLGYGVPITVGAAFSPSLQPVRDLAAGTGRVAAGDYSRRLPVVQDDDLGALAASFNRMQAGLAERQRLQAAFGTYVDPGLAARLLEQGDDVFTGERREVTVMFVDIRDFTPFAEANTAEDTVARLNAVFEIVVPAVVDVGGHVNKFLGDGALAVFGAPNDLADHADAAVSAAVTIAAWSQNVLAARFR
jgi:HAMP domain-containing protein